MRTEYMNRLVEQIRRSDFDAVLLCPSEELLFFAGFSPMMCERFQGLFVKEDGTMFYFCNLCMRMNFVSNCRKMCRCTPGLTATT